MKVLHIIESLEPSGCARQLQVLGPLWSQSAPHIEICCLEHGGAWGEMLRRAGVVVHELRWTRLLDLAAAWRLRDLVRRLQPDLIHAWRRGPLRALALAAPGALGRVVVSAPLPERRPLSRWDRVLLRRVRCLAVAGPSDAWQCAAAGVSRRPIALVPPALPRIEADPAVRRAPRGRRLVCLGTLDREHGGREAIWALDILNHLYADLHLLFAGSGPEQTALRAFVSNLHNTERIHFLGQVDAVAGLLRSAEVCWLPSRGNAGRQAALEAQAQGCAIVASDVPCLRDIIDDGRTGFLVPRGDVIALARRTRLLLDDAVLRRRLGQAAQNSALQQGDAAAAAQRWRELYGRLAA